MNQEQAKDVIDQLIDNTRQALDFAQGRLAKVEAEREKRIAQVKQLEKSLAILKGEEPAKKGKTQGKPHVWTDEQRAAAAERMRDRHQSRNGATAVA